MLFEVGGLLEGSWAVMALVGAIRREFPSFIGVDLAVPGWLLDWPWGGMPRSNISYCSTLSAAYCTQGYTKVQGDYKRPDGLHRAAPDGVLFIITPLHPFFRLQVLLLSQQT